MPPAEISALALQLLPNFSHRSRLNIFKNFECFSSIEAAQPSQLRELMSAETLRAWCSYKSGRGEHFDKVRREWELSQQHDIQLLSIESELYPKLLKESCDAPLLLYVRGDVNTLGLPQVAVIGARKASPTGRALAAEFAAELACRGYVVTSGLALGIDSEAHRGALNAACAGPLAQGAATIAVLGSGLLKPYPQRNTALLESIVQQGGAVVSEQPLKMAALSHHFPLRNRIIVGLSIATLVVEAALKSGSLISARLALEMDRELFAIPGSIRSELSRGCHQLIKQGAALVESVDDILTNLSHWQPWFQQQLFAEEAQEQLEGRQRQVLESVGWELSSIDTVLERSQLSLAELSEVLLELELSGHIENTGMGYVRL
ncbi:DNA-processing protein DprA [Agaribacterium haliotis]|uniref:DNA-processing protein DprA n=1 Tax=Agaribacterium haliotis TaxID=2013869 RepID=UPI001958A29D|nr:DNA-processing protein DprA [Agaribacterium haliotis]